MPRQRSHPSEQTLMLAISREEASSRIEDRIRTGQEIFEKIISNEQHLDAARNEYYSWDEYNRELLRRLFTTGEIVEEYSSSGGAFNTSDYTFADEVKDFKDDVSKAIRRLSSINDRLELIPLAPAITGRGKPTSTQTSNGKSVFIVHGHDDALLNAVARIVSQLELDPIILHEQASKGRTVVEKLEAHSDVTFAVVLLTPDDLGGTDEKHLNRRARQNVVLELGYFLARLGRENVTALHRGDLELPSDYMGVVYIPYDVGGAWKFSLAKELKAAGMPVDMNKIS